MSLMPCVAKKDEIERSQLTAGHLNKEGETKRMKDIDYVLVTRAYQ